MFTNHMVSIVSWYLGILIGLTNSRLIHGDCKAYEVSTVESIDFIFSLVVEAQSDWIFVEKFAAMVIFKYNFTKCIIDSGMNCSVTEVSFHYPIRVLIRMCMLSSHSKRINKLSKNVIWITPISHPIWRVEHTVTIISLSCRIVSCAESLLHGLTSFSLSTVSVCWTNVSG